LEECFEMFCGVGSERSGAEQRFAMLSTWESRWSKYGCGWNGRR
jgi:hypothetical protein